MEVPNAPGAPEVQAPQAKVQARPEAKTLGVDLARSRVSTDRRVTVAQGGVDKAEIKAAEEAVYSDILSEHRQRVDSLTETDPITIDAKSKGWSPDVQREAQENPGDRNGAKVWSQIGESVNAARKRHTIEVWGKFAQESPTTAANFARENPDVRIAIDAYKAQKLLEAKQFVDRSLGNLKVTDRTYLAAAQAGKTTERPAAESLLIPKAYDSLIEADPNAARFLAESNADPQIKAAYERYLARQEAGKTELAAQATQIATQSGPGAGLEVIAGVSDEVKRKRSEAAKKGAATRAAKKAAATETTETNHPGNIPIGPDGKPISWQRVNETLGFPSENPAIGPDGKPVSWDQVNQVLGFTPKPVESRAPSVSSEDSPAPPTPIRPETSTEAQKLPAKTRFAQAAMEAGRLNYEAQQARQNGLPATEAQTLETRAQEAVAKLDPLLAEVVTEEMVNNLTNEQDPNKRQRTAQDLVRNEEDPAKRNSLLSALFAAGILVAGAMYGGTSAAREAA